MKKLLLTLAVLIFAVVVSKLTFGRTASDNPSAAASANNPETSQSQPAAPRWYRVIELNMKPGALNDYMAFRVKERIPALKKAGYKHQEVWVSSVGLGGKIFVVEPMDDLSVFDQNPSRLVKVVGEEANQALLAKGAQYTAGFGRSYLLRSRPDLSWTSQMTAPAKFAIAARVIVARGRRADFENYIKNDYMPVVKKSGALGYAVSNVVYGGNPGEYVTLTFFNSFADIEKNDPGLNSVMTRVAGAETAQRNSQKTVGVITDDYERNIIRFRPEWSIMP